jgi:O-antigen ligase
MILRFLVAAALLLLALDGGGYGVASRHMLGVAVWWAIIVFVGLGLGPRDRLPGAALVVGGLLAAYALFTGASALWAVSSERVLVEFDRAALYLGVFLLAVIAVPRGKVRAVADGVAIGIASVAVVALASRFFPQHFDVPDIPSFLPGASARLAYPVNYWNGLAHLLALGIPLLLLIAVTSSRWAVRAAALGALPLIASALYLTSSRGGSATAAVGIVAFVALTSRRWRASAAVGVGALGSAAAILALTRYSAVVDDPFGARAVEEGRAAAALTLLACLGSGLGWGALSSSLPRASPVHRAAGWVAAGAAGVAAAVLVAAADPVERFRSFRQLPAEAGTPASVQSHLLSAGGSGRWQYWQAAWEQFESRPLLGRGAGSFEAWWAQHGTIPTFVRDAHSLYLETLGELGLVGLLLLASAFAAGLVAAARGLRPGGTEGRDTIAALAATFVAYTFAAGVDWMWELTIVSVVGIGCLGLLVRDDRDSPGGRRQSSIAIGVLLASWAILFAQAIPFLTQLKLRESQAEAAAGSFAPAARHAVEALQIQPWASSPRLQLALLAEQTGELETAHRQIVAATARDASDWRLWLVRARIETKSGDDEDARRSLATARSLNPRSPLFAGLRP